MKKIFLTIGSLAVLIGIIAIARSGDMTPRATDAGDQPTNFAYIGTLSFPNKDLGRGQDIPYFSYVSEPGAPTTTIELSLDPESVCAGADGATPCMAMSVQFRVPYDGKRAIVEGIEKEGKLTVRKMRVLADGEEGLVPSAGLIYIPWPQAVRLIEECKPKMVMQAHSLNVSLALEGSRVVHSVEPMIDELFRVLDRTQATCGAIPVATE